MNEEVILEGPPEEYCQLVTRLLDGDMAAGERFDDLRAAVRSIPRSDLAFQALCMLLEAALADPSLSIDDTRTVVTLLEDLARGTIAVSDVT